MKFSGTLISVKNIKASRKFYEDLFGLNVEFDFGANIAFDCGLYLQEGFADFLEINENEIKYKTYNFELYFEEEKFDDFIFKLKEYKDIEYVHMVKEFSWGQRSIRIYDLDKHIIEIGESMVTVVKRFLAKGLSVEETSKITQHPIDFVKKCI